MNQSKGFLSSFDRELFAGPLLPVWYVRKSMEDDALVCCESGEMLTVRDSDGGIVHHHTQISPPHSPT